MREDMFKVIVERPRRGSRSASNVKLRHDKCVGRQRATGRRMAQEIGGYKALNENLVPLKRYLHKQVGRHWDDVFSDICRCLDTGSTVKMHVREHIDDFVIRTISRDKAGSFIGQSRWGRPTRPSHWRQELYVDPVDGVLKRTTDLCKKLGVQTLTGRYWRRKEAPPNLRRQIRRQSDTEYLVRLDGLWYAIRINTSPNCTTEALLEEFRNQAWKHHERWKVITKQQLGKKALRDLGLQNQPEGAHGHG